MLEIKFGRHGDGNQAVAINSLLNLWALCEQFVHGASEPLRDRKVRFQPSSSFIEVMYLRGPSRMWAVNDVRLSRLVRRSSSNITHTPG
jgi:hypothetical protein